VLTPTLFEKSLARSCSSGRCRFRCASAETNSNSSSRKRVPRKRVNRGLTRSDAFIVKTMHLKTASRGGSRSAKRGERRNALLTHTQITMFTHCREEQRAPGTP
jgi:hypothetical protein